MCRSTILCPFLYEREEKNAFPKLSNVIFFPVIVSGQDFIDFFRRRHYVGHGNIMVHEVDDRSQEFTHIRFRIIRPGVYLRRLVGEICGDYPVEPAVFIRLVKGFQSVGEQAEGTADEDAFCIHFLQLTGGIKHAFTGGNHIIDDDNILAVNIVPQEFMSDNGILAVYDGGIIPAFIEHTGIDAENVAEVYGTIQRAFIRADDDGVLLINYQSSSVSSRARMN